MDKIHSKWRTSKGRVKGNVKLARQQAVQARINKLKSTPAQRNQPAASPSSQPQPGPSSEPQPGPSSLSSFTEPSQEGTSTFRRKVESFADQNTDAEPDKEYIVISKVALQELVKSKQTCRCRKSETVLVEKEAHGVAKKLATVCSVCSNQFNEVLTSPRIESETSTRPPFEINRMFVEGFISAGSGYSALETFSAETGIKTMGPITWADHLQAIGEENLKYKKTVLAEARKAVRAAHGANDNEILHITVSYDGTWHTRGHRSLYGIGAVVEVTTGLVVDFEVFSKYCHMCAIQKTNLGESFTEYKDWLKTHRESKECQVNYVGSSGGIEVAAAVTLWKRSVEEWKCRYTTVLSDGDAKTFLELTAQEIYGPDVPITKEECINHVSKRLTKGLEKIIEDSKVLGKTLGGRAEGALKKQTITQLGLYYRKAITDYAPNVEMMHRAIMATIFLLTVRTSFPFMIIVQTM